ncbi:Stress responsive A/B Barrel Domain [Raineyella antarctica]|uniref:Stress responsive A/B Barrel Domain n=1 Tax=Raineyella antarctica TaxID=1577474 RepID=A0A1G6IDZ8_9ACTN|nr:Dabb family protein [Raineyella antarctica]SDC04235.1 Stress responsive A/B Barrel Domain [Raineyella antarctica]
MPVAHVVTFTFVPGTPPETIAALSDGLRAVSAACTGIESYHHGGDLGLRPGTADYAIAAVFSDRDALARYLTHPEHLRVNADFGPIIAAKSSAQFAAGHQEQKVGRP